MNKNTHIHRVKNYDLNERIEAIKEGFIVEFSYREFIDLGYSQNESIKLLKEGESCVIIKQEHKVSGWESLFS